MKETVKRALDLLRRKEWEACDYASNVSEAADILEKGLQALAAPVQEPVLMWDGKYQVESCDLSAYKRRDHSWIPLYTTPPAAQRQPLTEELVDTLYESLASDERTKQFTAKNWFQAGLASGEAAHGIKEKNT
jgi:hypothetical protein